MTSAVTAMRDSNLVTIRVVGHFGFQVYHQFRDAYLASERGTRFRIDLQAVDYIDSSALGMLLVLREHSGGEMARIEITHCRPEVHKILLSAHFDRLFSIS